MPPTPTSKSSGAAAFDPDPTETARDTPLTTANAAQSTQAIAYRQCDEWEIIPEGESHRSTARPPTVVRRLLDRYCRCERNRALDQERRGAARDISSMPTRRRERLRRRAGCRARAGALLNAPLAPR